MTRRKNFCLLCALLAAWSVASAQEFRASLQGTVADPSKAVIPSASVTLRNVETAVERTSSTDTEGFHVLQFLRLTF